MFDKTIISVKTSSSLRTCIGSGFVLPVAYSVWVQHGDDFEAVVFVVRGNSFCLLCHFAEQFSKSHFLRCESFAVKLKSGSIFLPKI